MIPSQGPLQTAEFRTPQLGGVHVAGALDQVVGLVDQEEVLAPGVEEVAAQVGLGIEDVVVVADDRVRPQGEVERQLERADGVPPGHLLDRGPRGRFQRKGLVDGVVDAVVVAEGVLAGLLVAGASSPGVEADAGRGR